MRSTHTLPALALLALAACSGGENVTGSDPLQPRLGASTSRAGGPQSGGATTSTTTTSTESTTVSDSTSTGGGARGGFIGSGG